MTVAVVNQSTNKELQAQLKKAIAAIDKKIKSLGGVGSHTYTIGNYQFRFDEHNTGSPAWQLNSIWGAPANILLLIKMYAHLSAKKKEYEDAAKSLGLETYPVHTYNGVATEVVLKDLGHAIKLLGNLDTINKLNAKRTELSQFLSADEKLAGALNGLKELLK